MQHAPRRRPMTGRRLVQLGAPALALLALAWSGPTPAQAQHGQSDHPEGWVGGPGSANWELAARFAPYKVQDMVYSLDVDPNWIEGTESFWYDYETSEGTFWWIVDPARGTKRQIFDRDRIAAELTRIVGDPYDARNLPIRSIRFIDGNTLQFEVQSSLDEEVEEEEADSTDMQQQEEQNGQRQRQRTEKRMHYFEYDVGTRTLRELEDFEEPDDHPNWARVSPDGEWVVFARDFNLWMISGADYQRILDARRGLDGEEADSAADAVEVNEIQLTEDGEEHYSWGFGGFGETDDEEEENAHDRRGAPIVWSKDSEKFAVIRSDQREVGELWVIHSTGNDRPQLESYRYEMPGEEKVTQRELYVFDMAAREMTRVNDDPWPDQDMSILDEPQFRYPDSTEPFRSLWASDDSGELWFVRDSRDRKKRDLLVYDTETGEVRVVVEERFNSALEDIDNPDPRLLPNGDVLWWSERDGWAHLYRFANDGTLRNRLTEGPFSVREIVSVDEANGVVFFQAAGREDDDSPYYQHLYRVGLDGSRLRLLNAGNFDFESEASESSRFFVDNFSRVNTVPTSVVRNAAGEVVVELEEADFSQLLGMGWQFPEPYTVKAADGVTDLYGVMYKPFDFDSTRIYPIVEYVYPGPQGEAVSSSFSTATHQIGLAQTGMIVVSIGNRGGDPRRSKWYHNYGYGNLRDYGLADKKVAIEQLAARHRWIDMDRVGIYGHSGGGFMSTAAILVYPDFFDVAVSSSGNHDNRIYNRWWSETHHGVQEQVDDSGKVSFEYDIDFNQELAHNLKGKLLLTYSDEDSNVHPANTIRMARALIDAGKRFDLFVFPGLRHSYNPLNDYWYWIRTEYFVKHLLGDERTAADIVEVQREQEADQRRPAR